jgi:hypothetical protein
MERVPGTDEEIANMCEKHRQLFICWDGYFSGLQTKRFHLTDAIVKKTKEFLVRSVVLDRHYDEVKRKNPKVEAYIAQLLDKNKRKSSGETKARKAPKHAKAN